MKILKFLSGFFLDQNGQSSSKRLVGFVSMFYLFLIVKGSLIGSVVNSEVLYTVGGIVLFCIGAITSEFFLKKNKNEKDNSITTN